MVSVNNAAMLTRRTALSALALAYWTRFPVPPLSPSREMRLPISDSLADDPGLYWIVPRLMEWTGLDVHHAVWALALAAFAVAVLVQRSELQRFALIVLAPWWINYGGPYWIAAWVMWMALPAGPRMAGAVGVLVTPFRAAAGLPALAWSFRSWKVGLVSVAAFLAISTLGSHVLWHQLYIGLGWFTNPWGIVYLDEAGMAATTAVYASPEYEAALRSLVIAHVLEQPAWFALQLVGKFGAALALVFPWCLALVLAPRLWIPAALALAPLVATVPIAEYSTGLSALSVYAVGEVMRRRFPRPTRWPQGWQRGWWQSRPRATGTAP